MPVDPDDLAADDLRRVADIGRAVTGEDRELHEPPPDLWSKISAEAFETPSDASAPTHEATTPTGRERPDGSIVVDLDARRARRNRTIVGIAAAVVLLAGVAALLVANSDRGGNEVVASADLELLAGSGEGAAELVERGDGLHLLVDVSDLEPAEQADFYELWLLAPDVSDMASLTRFTTSSGEIDVRLPDNVDPDTLPVVDISEEVDDGDDTHSGLSILRGTLS